MPRACQDLPPDLLASILAFIPCLKVKIRLATVAKGWRAALASPGSYSRGCSPRQWGGGHPFGTVDFEGPEAPMLQQDVLAALAAGGIQFQISQLFTSWAWLPPTVRRLDFTGRPPADCPTLACVEEVWVTILLDRTPLDVTRFPSARFLRASFELVSELELEEASPEYLSQGPHASITEITWLEQLAALPQLARVELECGEFSPGKVSIQLPAGCELVVRSDGKEDSTLSELLPHRASLPHVVMLDVDINIFMGPPHIDFSCLASCPNLRDFWLAVYDYNGNAKLEDHLDWVDVSTLNDVPICCSLMLGFRDADTNVDSYKPPAGWSVAPHRGRKELICFRHDSQDCTAEPNSCWHKNMDVWEQMQAMVGY